MERGEGRITDGRRSRRNFVLPVGASVDTQLRNLHRLRERPAPPVKNRQMPNSSSSTTGGAPTTTADGCWTLDRKPNRQCFGAPSRHGSTLDRAEAVRYSTQCRTHLDDHVDSEGRYSPNQGGLEGRSYRRYGNRRLVVLSVGCVRLPHRMNR